MSIRVCIADNHPPTLAGVTKALEAAAEIDVVGTARPGNEVLALVDELRPDVVLLDNRIGGDSIACLKLIRRRHPDTKLVLVCTSADSAQLTEALSAGADAYIGRRIDHEDVVSSVRLVVAGVVYQSSPASTVVRRRAPIAPATSLSASASCSGRSPAASARSSSAASCGSARRPSSSTSRTSIASSACTTARARCATPTLTGSWRRRRPSK